VLAVCAALHHIVSSSAVAVSCNAYAVAAALQITHDVVVAAVLQHTLLYHVSVQEELLHILARFHCVLLSYVSAAAALLQQQRLLQQRQQQQQ
jgi:aryl-alcohol dehydrogenase-like predicted oxidoreductase